MKNGTIAIFVILGLFVIYSVCKKIRDIKKSKQWIVDPDGAAKSKFPHHCRCKYKEHVPGLEINGRQW